MKKIVLIGTVSAILVVAGMAIAKGVERTPSTVMPSGETVVVPGQATDNSPVLEKAIFIHYEKGFAKPPEAGAKKPSGPACYGFLSRGVYWKETPVSYVIHPDLEAVVPGAVFTSAETWDGATLKDLFGGYELDGTATWDGSAPDGRNEMVFGNYPQQGVIAVTVVWGYFSGPIQTRKIVEFDILFDIDYIWGDADLNSAVMDLQNIATHEIGHGVGLADIYDTTCSAVTMYGYSKEGETDKRTLETPDITGLQKLYGN